MPHSPCRTPCRHWAPSIACGARPEQEIAGIDLRWSLATARTTWVGCAQLAGEDESNATPSKWIAAVGLQLKHATPTQRLEWSAQASDTRLGRLFGLRPDKREPGYTHGTNVDGHYHQGLPVGAFIGGGGALASAGLAVVPIGSPSAMRYEMRVWRAQASQQGPAEINAAYGRPAQRRPPGRSRAAAARALIRIRVQRHKNPVRPEVLVEGLRQAQPERDLYD